MKKKNLNPEWNEKFVMKFKSWTEWTEIAKSDNPMVLEVMDYDFGATDDYLGAGSVALHELEPNQGAASVIQLEQYDNKGTVVGRKGSVSLSLLLTLPDADHQGSKEDESPTTGAAGSPRASPSPMDLAKGLIGGKGKSNKKEPDFDKYDARGHVPPPPPPPPPPGKAEENTP